LNCRSRNIAAVLGAVAFGLAAAVLVAEEQPSAQKRARPPKWTPEVSNIFFPDARKKLVGTRPDYSKQQTAFATAGNANDSAATAQAPGAWSKLIDAETIETEIKRAGQELAKAVTTPSAFKGGGYKDCRRIFSVLAALFAVDAEYDGEVRWRDAAPTFRDLFARAGYNCKAGSDQTYQEATRRKQNMADLVAGNRPKPSTAERKADWSKVADREPLMQRMNIAHEDRLKKWVANKTEFKAHQDEVRHEAQLVATIADIIGREGFEYWDDEQYAKFAVELRQAAADVAKAAELDNVEQAQQANNRMTKACADCHEGFRG
jgi:hypothetical protein